MSGLLAQLDLEIGNFDVGALLGGVIGQVAGLGGAVEGLTGGPGVVGELQNVLANPPQPEGLDGVANFRVHVEGSFALIPTDTSGPLAPLLAPFEELRAGVNLGVSVTGLMAAYDAIKALVELTTGRVFGGPSPMPEGEEPGETLDLAQIRGSLDSIEAQVAELGDLVDPSRLLAILQRFAPGAQDLHSRWPKLPITADMFEALDVIGRWQELSPAELTTELHRSLGATARFVALPRTRLIDPTLAAARAAGGAAPILDTAQAELAPILRALPSTLAAGGQPSAEELRQMQAQLDALEPLAQVLGLTDSPLGTIEALPRMLEREFMRVLRVVNPAIDRASLEQQVRNLVTRIPAADPSPFGDLVSEIEGLDLSAITDPLSAVRSAIETAVSTAEGALTSVREALEDLLRPLSEGIATLVGAIGLDRLQDALGELPDLITGFVDGEVRTRLTSLRGDIEGAVTTVSDAVEAFDPEAIKQDIEDMVRQIASVIQNDTVRGVFAGAQAVVGEIVETLDRLPQDLRSAADESTALLDDISAVASQIPSELIPDAVKPTLQEAVDSLVDLDITGTVGQPLADGVDYALEEGALPILSEFEGLLSELRERLESFRPSSLISDEIEQPFQDVLTTLRGFAPSDLLDQIADALAQLREQIHVVEPAELLGPLLELHAQLRTALEQVEPERLLQPVEDMIQGAIADLLDASGVGEAFAGVRDFLEQLDGWVDLLDRAHVALAALAARLAQPIGVEAQLEALSAGALAQLEGVDMAALAEPLEAARVAATSLDARRIAADLAPALRAAATAPDALAGPARRALGEALAQLPEDEALRSSSDELAELVGRLRQVDAALVAAVDPWHALGPRLQGMAGRLETELRGYALLATLDGRPVLAGLLDPPADVAGLGEQVGEALRESLRLPVSILAAVLERVAPHAAGFASDLGRLLGAFHAKLDAITGEAGLLGAVTALDEGLDLLRNFDLAPITDPLREHVYLPLMGVVDDIDPEPLRAILQAVKDALEDLLDLANLFDRATIDTLDQTYASAVEKLAAFSPRTLLIDTLDPVYEELLADILPLFELVTALREALERSAEELPPEIVAQLGRVEVSFDNLLRSLPLEPSGGPAISASASVSVSAGGGG